MSIFGPVLSLWRHGWGRLHYSKQLHVPAVQGVPNRHAQSGFPFLLGSLSHHQSRVGNPAALAVSIKIQQILNNLPNTHCTVTLLGSLESHLLTLHIDRNFSWAFWGNRIPCYLKILDCALSLLLLTARWSQVFVGGRVLLGGYWLRTGKLGTWWAVEISWWFLDWSVSISFSLSTCT